MINLESYELVAGVGNRDAHQLCVMSLAALLAGEAHGDKVSCVCPVVRAFAIRLNDSLPDDARQSLKPVSREILGTRGQLELELRRAYRCADWAVREVAAEALESHGHVDSASELRKLPPIVDVATARAASDAARNFSAADAARAADYADYAACAADYASRATSRAADYAASIAADYAALAADYAARAAAAADRAAAAADRAAAAADFASIDAIDAADAHKRSIAFLRELCAMREETP